MLYHVTAAKRKTKSSIRLTDAQIIFNTVRLKTNEECLQPLTKASRKLKWSDERIELSNLNAAKVGNSTAGIAQNKLESICR